MLPKIHRLNRQKDFDAIFQRGALAQDIFLAIRFLPNQQKISRFGFIISAKVAKRAVERNRLRRQLGEVIRAHLKKISPKLDFILIVKTKLIGASYEEIEGILISLLKKKKLYA